MTAALAAALVASVLAKTEGLVAAQAGKDARDVAALDRRAEALAEDLKPAGWLAAAPLGAAARDHERPAKVRLFATSYLGFIADPAAFAPLEDVLLDARQPAFVRSLAAQSLPGTGAPDAAVSRALCAALAQEELPREAAEIALLPLSRLGCPEPSALVRLAKSAGPRPSGRDLALVGQAAAALAASRGAESGRALLSLVSYFPPQGDARARAIAALDARRAELAAWLAPETLPAVVEALRTEGPRWDTMLALVRAASALGSDAAPALARLSRHSDAEVLVAAAEALAAAGLPQPKAAADFESIAAGAMSDPRFSPREGRPDPAALLARLEKAIAALKRLR
jgi:hypothetical protein